MIAFTLTMYNWSWSLLQLYRHMISLQTQLNILTFNHLYKWDRIRLRFPPSPSTQSCVRIQWYSKRVLVQSSFTSRTHLDIVTVGIDLDWEYQDTVPCCLGFQSEKRDTLKIETRGNQFIEWSENTQNYRNSEEIPNYRKERRHADKYYYSYANSKTHQSRLGIKPWKVSIIEKNTTNQNKRKATTSMIHPSRFILPCIYWVVQTGS